MTSSADSVICCTPEPRSPERIITASEIAGLAQDGRTPNGRVTQRWGVPLLAAACSACRSCRAGGCHRP